jgi:hypothetical protein
MVFSTVQISMPGTSCALLSDEISTQDANSARTKRASLPIMEIPINIAITSICAEPLRGIKDTTLKPHSRGEVSDQD